MSVILIGVRNKNDRGLNQQQLKVVPDLVESVQAQRNKSRKLVVFETLSWFYQETRGKMK